MNGSEEDAPHAVTDLLEPDVEAAEEVRDEDLLTVPSDGGVLRDEPGLEVVGIGDLWEPLRKWPEGGLVDDGGSALLEGLVWAFLVVDAAEGVEGSLLGG